MMDTEVLHMPYEEAERPAKEHSVSMLNRERLSLTGVDDVSAFDESAIILTTSFGDLTVRGDALHIGCIDLELGRLEVEGHICELCYGEPREPHSLWTRLFG